MVLFSELEYVFLKCFEVFFAEQDGLLEHDVVDALGAGGGGDGAGVEVEGLFGTDLFE